MSNPPTFPQRVQDAAKVMKITEDKLYSYLSQLGIDKDDEDALALLEAETTTMQDAQVVFCPSGSQSTQDGLAEGKVPVARFKAGWAVLKGKTKASGTSVPSDTESILKSLRSVKNYKDSELLDEYGPDCSSDLIEELRRRTQDRPFLIFNGESLNSEDSLKMLRIARREPTNPRHVLYSESGPKTVRLFRVGQFPTIWIEESPIHPDVLLVDGYCRRCENTWLGVGDADRVIVRVAVDVGGIDVSSLVNIHELISRVRKEGAKFLLDVPAVQDRYSELEENKRLPVLRRRATSNGSGGQSDPLFVKHSQY